jgi:hypothetical protein
MRNKIAVLSASVPLMLSVAGAFGSELHFQTPTTDRAQQTQPLLSRAAQAVHDKLAGRGADRISDLWLFPTGDEHAIFAQYTVTTKQTSSKATAAQVHLELLQMEGDRVVDERDLTHIGDDNALHAQQASGGRDWSAAIGNGHTTSSTAQTSAQSAGSPASAHWSALIGSGHSSDESTQRVKVAGNVTGSQAARAHWTSKIGTARAVDSNTSTPIGKSSS